MSKTRVSELAKRYNIKSNEVIAKLGEIGEFVKTASSSIELPAVKKFEQQFGAELDSRLKPAAAAPAEAAATSAATAAPAAPAATAAPAAPAVDSAPVTPAKSSAPRPGPRPGPKAPVEEPPAPEPEPIAVAPVEEPPAPPVAPATSAPEAEPGDSTSARPAPRPAAKPGAPRPATTRSPPAKAWVVGPRLRVNPTPLPTSVRRGRRRLATECRVPTRR